MAFVSVTKNFTKLRELPRRLRGAVGGETRMIALDLLSEGVRRAPVKEGTLRGSGTAHFGGERIASGAQFDPQAIPGEGADGGLGSSDTEAIVAFNAIYAEAQHERTDFVHPIGGEAKYLERPLEANRAQYERRIREAVRRVLR